MNAGPRTPTKSTLFDPFGNEWNNHTTDPKEDPIVWRGEKVELHEKDPDGGSNQARRNEYRYLPA